MTIYYSSSSLPQSLQESTPDSLQIQQGTSEEKAGANSRSIIATVVVLSHRLPQVNVFGIKHQKLTKLYILNSTSLDIFFALTINIKIDVNTASYS